MSRLPSSTRVHDETNDWRRSKKQLQQSLLEANTGCLLMFLLVFGLPFITLGLFFVYQGLTSINAQLRLNANVVSVPATILSSEVRSTTTNVGSETGHNETYYWVDIEFTYEYKGQMRKSDRVWPVAEGGREVAMRKVVKRYPPDAQVTALVNEENPDLAFLEKRWSSMPDALVCVGSLPLVFFAALGIVLVGWKRPSTAILFGLSIGMLVIVSISITGISYCLLRGSKNPRLQAITSVELGYGSVLRYRAKHNSRAAATSFSRGREP
ncbi:MAG: DUF3592 domain-containing protein, partial [Pirellulales bacterium]